MTRLFFYCGGPQLIFLIEFVPLDHAVFDVDDAVRIFRDVVFVGHQR